MIKLKLILFSKFRKNILYFAQFLIVSISISSFSLISKSDEIDDFEHWLIQNIEEGIPFNWTNESIQIKANELNLNDYFIEQLNGSKLIMHAIENENIKAINWILENQLLINKSELDFKILESDSKRQSVLMAEVLAIFYTSHLSSQLRIPLCQLLEKTKFKSPYKYKVILEETVQLLNFYGIQITLDSILNKIEQDLKSIPEIAALSFSLSSNPQDWIQANSGSTLIPLIRSDNFDILEMLFNLKFKNLGLAQWINTLILSQSYSTAFKLLEKLKNDSKYADNKFDFHLSGRSFTQIIGDKKVQMDKLEDWIHLIIKYQIPITIESNFNITHLQRSLINLVFTELESQFKTIKKITELLFNNEPFIRFFNHYQTISLLKDLLNKLDLMPESNLGKMTEELIFSSILLLMKKDSYPPDLTQWTYLIKKNKIHQLGEILNLQQKRSQAQYPKNMELTAFENEFVEFIKSANSALEFNAQTQKPCIECEGYETQNNKTYLLHQTQLCAPCMKDRLPGFPKTLKGQILTLKNNLGITNQDPSYASALFDMAIDKNETPYKKDTFNHLLKILRLIQLKPNPCINSDCPAWGNRQEQGPFDLECEACAKAYCQNCELEHTKEDCPRKVPLRMHIETFIKDYQEMLTSDSPDIPRWMPCGTKAIHSNCNTIYCNCGEKHDYHIGIRAFAALFSGYLPEVFNENSEDHRTTQSPMKFIAKSVTCPICSGKVPLNLDSDQYECSTKNCEFKVKALSIFSIPFYTFWKRWLETELKSENTQENAIIAVCNHFIQSEEIYLQILNLFEQCTQDPIKK